MTDSPSPSDTPALPEATEDLIDHACSLAMGYGTGRDDIAGQFIHAKVAVKARFAALLARAEAAEKRAQTAESQRDEVIARSEAYNPSERQQSLIMAEAAAIELAETSQARIDALTAEVARLMDGLRSICELAPGSQEWVDGRVSLAEESAIARQAVSIARAALSPVKQEPHNG